MIDHGKKSMHNDYLLLEIRMINFERKEWTVRNQSKQKVPSQNPQSFIQ